MLVIRWDILLVIYIPDIKEKKVYEVENEKKISRVALLTGCVQRIISPEINESTIRLLNRHDVEVVVLPKIDCCGSLNHHLGKKELAHSLFVKNIKLWHEEYWKSKLHFSLCRSFRK